MTKLGEEYTFNYMCLKTFYRLPVVCGDDCFLINVGNNSVIKIRERKLLHTWTLKTPHSFTCPVVFNDIDSTICCVMDTNTLIIWSNDNETLEGSTKVKFQESIFGVIPVTGGRPVVIFSNGKCVTFDHAISDMKKTESPCLKPGEKLIGTDAVVNESNISVIYLTYIEKGKKYYHHCFTLNIDDGIVRNFHTQIISHETASLKNWCMKKYNGIVSLLTIWSDGKILCSCDGNNTPETILNIPDIQKKNVLAIDVIDSSHIALIKANSSRKENMLEIWDTKFSALKGRKSLDSLSSNFTKIAVIKSTIFLSSNDNLVAIPVCVERSTLATAIGKTITSSKQTTDLVYSWNDKGHVEELFSSDKQTNLLQIVDLSVELKAEKLIEDLLPKIENSHINPIELSANLKTIPESELVQALLFAINFKSEISESKKQGKSNMQSKLAIILNIVFCAPYSDVFLVKHLRKLTLKEALVILELLLAYLNDSIMTSKSFPEKPADLQIVNWTYLVIQSHSEELLLSKDRIAAKLLTKIYRAVSKKMEAYAVLEEIEYLLKLLKKTNILPEKNMQDKYCIEVLCL